jgi:hypothetical protein
MPDVKIVIYQLIGVFGGDGQTKVMVRAEREVTAVGTSVEINGKV